MNSRLRVAIVFAILLASAHSSFAQTTTTSTQSPQQSSPNQMTTTPAPAAPEFPAPTAEDAARCAGKIPQGGVPNFLRSETAEQRKARIGVTEDPGCDPDPKQEFWRFGKRYTIERFERRYASYEHGGDENYIRPFGPMFTYREVYQQNELYVWVWQPVRTAEEINPPIDIHQSTQGGHKFSDAEVEVLQRMRSEFFEVTTSESPKTIRFEESSTGLPVEGSFRNSLTVADMNGDGKPDIIVPAERGGGFYPSIYLGDGKGGWKLWENVKWPHAIAYGSVVAADFNKDGKMDLAFAAHLDGIYVLMGDGKGTFIDDNEGLPHGEFGSRRILVRDVDGDGYPDLVTISEGPTAVHSAGVEARGQIRVYLNREKGKKWQRVDVTTDKNYVAGDWLAAGDFNGDKRVDVSAANIYMGSPDTIYLGQPGLKWSLVDSKMGRIIPYLSYYFATAAGKFSSTKRDDLLVSYVRFWRKDINPAMIPTPPLQEVTGIDRISFTADGPKRTPVMRWGNKFGVSGMATGDFDGDGNLDVVFTNSVIAEKRTMTILLGDGKGNFSRAKTEGLTAEPRVTYDLKVADVNGDGRPDIIIMYEADEGSSTGMRVGSIHVFLNRGPVAAASTK